MQRFASLHCHTQTSPLDSIATSNDYVQRAEELGITAISITDHGRLSGHREHQRACEGTGVKPILGIETYFSPTDRFDKRSKANRGELDTVYDHLIIHAKNENGLKNLNNMNAEAWNSYYYQPRIDRELIQQYGQDLIITSACMSGPISKALRAGNEEVAYTRAQWFKDQMGDDFYIEVMAENDPELNQALLKLADDLGIKPILTEDSHYVDQDGLWLEEAYLILSTRPKPDKNVDPSKLKSKDMIGKFNELYGKERPMTFQDFSIYMAGREFREQQMLQQDIERTDIYENTLEIADKIGEYPYHKNLNLIPRPKAVDPDEKLRQICINGMKEKGLIDSLEHSVRLDHELEVVKTLGLAPYFLIISDAIRWCKSQGMIVGPGRGSSGGSLMCFVAGITDIDPLEYGLLFERFLDVSRGGTDPADVDIDLSPKDRERLKHYLEMQYKHVANIATESYFQEKGALKSAASILQVPFNEANKAIKELTTENAFAEYAASPNLKEFRKKYPDVMTIAKGLEGKKSSSGAHSAGMIISREPIANYVPMETRAIGENKERVPVVAYDMAEVSEIGLVKYDFLSLKTLDVMKDVAEVIKERHGKDIVYTEIPLDDTKTFKMLSDGYTKGVFQAEASPYTKLILNMGIDSFDDIVVAGALVRPGAMDAFGKDFIACKRGRKKVKLIHPIWDEICKDTYGFPLYQEQWMQINHEMAGFTKIEANKIRKLTAKKQEPETLEPYREQFIDGMVEHIDQQLAEKLWEDQLKTANYSFNKSHSVGYGLMTYWTAWIKANYGTEFVFALLNNEKEKASITNYLIEAKRMGIPIVLPHVSVSEIKHTIDHTGIKLGLSSIKYISENVADKIIKGRPFKTYTELEELSQTKYSGINSRALSSLNKVGAAAFEDNPRTGKESQNYYEFLGIPAFSTGDLEPRITDQFVPLDEVSDKGAYIVHATIQTITRKDGWCRLDLIDATGSFGVFVDPTAPFEAGMAYVMLIADNSVVRYSTVDDVINKRQTAMIEYLYRTEYPDTPDEMMKVIAFKSRDTKAGKKMATVVFSTNKKELTVAYAFGKSFQTAFAYCRPGEVVDPVLGEWNGKTVINNIL